MKTTKIKLQGAVGMVLFAIVGCGLRVNESVEYRCLDGSTDEQRCNTLVPGVLRHEYAKPGHGDCLEYWVPCSKATHEDDVVLCRRVGAAPVPHSHGLLAGRIDEVK